MTVVARKRRPLPQQSPRGGENFAKDVAGASSGPSTNAFGTQAAGAAVKFARQPPRGALPRPPPPPWGVLPRRPPPPKEGAFVAAAADGRAAADTFETQSCKSTEGAEGARASKAWSKHHLILDMDKDQQEWAENTRSKNWRDYMARGVNHWAPKPVAGWPKRFTWGMIAESVQAAHNIWKRKWPEADIPPTLEPLKAAVKSGRSKVPVKPGPPVLLRSVPKYPAAKKRPVKKDEADEPPSTKRPGDHEAVMLLPQQLPWPPPTQLPWPSPVKQGEVDGPPNSERPGDHAPEQPAPPTQPLVPPPGTKDEADEPPSTKRPRGHEAVQLKLVPKQPLFPPPAHLLKR